MEEGILSQTGKPVTHWIDLLRKSGLEKHGEMVSMLKTEHEFTHGYANYVAHKARESDAGSHDDDELVTTQYKGKENLKPIYDALMKAVEGFEGLEIAPKKSSVSLRGPKRQFALIQPTTKSRIDLGLKFNDKPVDSRLQSSGPFGTMCTHRVILTETSEVDNEVVQLLRDAFDEAG